MKFAKPKKPNAKTQGRKDAEKPFVFLRLRVLASLR